jgi:ethanolamine ammonia-lyase small subunit
MSEIEPSNPGLAARLRALTPARVGLGRTGVSQQTRHQLDFQRAHAQARDAVHARLESGSLAADLAAITALQVLLVRSAAIDRSTYLQRPDLGRKLDEASSARLIQASEAQQGSVELVLIVADGLSAFAAERHVAPLFKELLPRLASWKLGPVIVVEQGRVAIGDQIGSMLGAQVSVVFIGERPGLSSPDSLGVYITWNPQPGRTDAERNCISNIRAEGLSYRQAAAQLHFYLTDARQRRLTGVHLKAAPQLKEG